LKSPFSVHPKTGRVSVPIDLNRIDDFDPFKVPNISQICNEVDEFDSRNPTSQLEKFEKTSIRSSVNRFSKFINELVNDNKQLRNKKSDETMEF
jgi:DNA primase small subunit